MSVIRVDPNKCIGCENCVNICPMDVFYFNKEKNRSIILYPENCQSCGQCYVNCKGHSLGITNDTYGYPITAYRGVTSKPMDYEVISNDDTLFS